MTALEKATRAGCLAGGIDPDGEVTVYDKGGIRRDTTWKVHAKLYAAALKALVEVDDSLLRDVPDSDRIEWPDMEYTNRRQIWAGIIEAILEEGGVG